MSPEPGPLADEAARLVETVRLWWASAGPPAAPPGEPYPTGGDGGERPWWSSDAQGAQHAEHAHVGEAAECRVCPVCRLIAVARTVRPEVVEHLLAASSSLVAALRAAVDTPETPGTDQQPPAPPGPRRRPPGPGVEHIDIT